MKKSQPRAIHNEVLDKLLEGRVLARFLDPMKILIIISQL